MLLSHIDLLCSTLKVLSRNARFEQIWRSRKLQKDNPGDDAIYDMCRLYDVVRIDVEEHAVKEHIVEAKNQKYGTFRSGDIASLHKL